MRITFGQSRAHTWRVLLIIVALLVSFSSTLNPDPTSAQAVKSQYLSPALQRSVATDAPVPAAYAVSAGRSRYFSQTGHFLRGAFLTYWETHGATAILGLPLTEALDEGGLVVQYLERARLEWHPEISSNPRQQVLLTRLGIILAERRGLTFEQLSLGTNTPTSVFFTETGHNLSNAFLKYWRSKGGLAVFGYPISEEIAEVSPTDGKTYAVQYFERNRFEWHPENPPAFNVQIGLLGVEYARMSELNPLARVLLPFPVRDAQDLSDSPQLADLVDPDLLPAVQALGRTVQFRWVPVVLIENSIPVEFADVGEEGVAGAIVTTRSRIHPYTIVIPETERGESIFALASILAHEATHAFNLTSGLISSRTRCSVEEELRAYMNGLAAWVLLEGEDALDKSYASGSLDAAINRSVKGFNSDKDFLDFDFNVQNGRQFLKELYGSDCGQ